MAARKCSLVGLGRERDSLTEQLKKIRTASKGKAKASPPEVAESGYSHTSAADSIDNGPG